MRRSNSIDQQAGFENGQRVPVTTPLEIDDMDGRGPHAPEWGTTFSEGDEERIEREVDRRVKSDVCGALNQLLNLIIDAEKPRCTAYQIAYALGAGAAVGGSAASIARKFGISRQAFEQEGKRQLDSLRQFLRKNPLEKKQGAAETYRRANFRRGKLK